MLAKVHSCAVIGLDALPIQVEVDIAGGLERITVVGLPDAAVRESSERMRSAITNSGLFFPNHRLTVNLAPADLRKVGPAYDLPIAVGILAAARQILADLDDALIVGELSLDGAVRHVSGVLPLADLARQKGWRRVFVPSVDAQEAALVHGVEVYAVDTLRALLRHQEGTEEIEPTAHTDQFGANTDVVYPVDFADVKGQTYVRRRVTCNDKPASSIPDSGSI